jgi:RES domain-containing protein
LRFSGVCYRAHDPKWAWGPISGDGAAAKGGRFNPVGVPALYLALSIEGLFAEMGHGFARRFDPLTVCCYDVDVDGVVDLRSDADRASAGVDLGQLACAWLEDRLQRRKPASWTVAEWLIAGGASGILVPSFANGPHPDMANLVLWAWGPDPQTRVTVYDPGRRLPKDQAS